MRASGRLLTVLLLAFAALVPIQTFAARQAGTDASAGPNVGDRVRVEDVDRNEIAVISVVKLDDPAPLSDQDSGFREIGVDIAIENVGASPYHFSSNDFDAIDSNGIVYDDVRADFDDKRLDDPTADVDSAGATPSSTSGRAALSTATPSLSSTPAEPNSRLSRSPPRPIRTSHHRTHHLSPSPPHRA